jgi:transposase
VRSVGVGAGADVGGGGSSHREIARQLGINRRTVIWLARSDELPQYRRERTGSLLDPLEPVLRELVQQWPQTKAPRATEILRERFGYGSDRPRRCRVRLASRAIGGRDA